jgi:histidinol phosphatase-like PHP family hydrolase
LRSRERRALVKEIPKVDLHTHTTYLGCANETMQIPAIVRECERLGVTALGITDHLNSLDRLDLHTLIRRDIEALDTDIDVYFGVELNFCAPDGGFAFSPEVKDEYGFQFAIGGIHGTYLDTYDVKALVDIQHRHHLKTCRDPLVDVLVHPYWFGRGEFDRNEWPWFDSMRAVPEAYARELGQVARETGTAVEINACANFVNPNYSDAYVREYVDYLAVIAEEGACFALGSDAHDIGRLSAIETVWRVAAELGLTGDRIWLPACGPMNTGGGEKE